jgi:hypothetical protein
MELEAAGSGRAGRFGVAIKPDVGFALRLQGGEVAAAIEVRRLFPGITDNAQARACARTIAGWKPSATKLPAKR